ncbi:serine/arginine-rich splicing factor 11 isoform X1 [Astyanax mexicanus]|uniref:Serine/arginine-rich splicing factor 11 n=3 Tax=Astyanax mexicanus TaxID=7994 RepID=A0A8B9KR34_ASTMX|nr:serine/arginine-rich splicing factor 11 isoform X1 [Astyanax mexicanus]KAG9267053.1 serine/arginine-rich splicing factor 11 isoform X1 [Astyanax mexicanus]
MNSSTNVVQVTNVSPSATSEQMRTLFGFLGNIEELKLFPPDDSPLPVTSRVCFVKFLESESVGVSQHLTNTVFVDRALIVVPFAEGVIPDESKALSLLAPANAVAGLLPGGGLLPTPNPVPSIGGVPLGSLGGPAMDAMAALGMPGPNMNPQSLSAEQLMKLMASIDPKLNPMAAGLNLNPGLKADASNKEIEEAMKRVREAQSLISAAIEPGNKKDDKRKHSRSRSRSRRRRSRSRSKYRRSKSRSRRRSRSRSKRRSKSPRKRRSHSKDRSRRSRSRDRRKEDKGRKRSKTPPKSYSSARRSRSTSRRHRRSRSMSRSPKKSRSPKRRLSRTPSPRRHKKEKKKDKERDRDRERDRRDDRDRNRDKRERSTSKKSKDKEKERDRKSDGEKSDVKVTRDYDEEEQGYDSEREEEQERSSDVASSPQAAGLQADSADDAGRGESDGPSDEQQDEDMDMSD